MIRCGTPPTAAADPYPLFPPLRPRDLDRLDPGDSVLVIAPPAQAAALDELFAERPTPVGDASFGEFTFDGDLPLGKLAEFYDLPVHRQRGTVWPPPSRYRRQERWS